MYGYIYKTTCLVNNKIYIGQHCSSTFDIAYKGSGILFKKALKKFGANNFLTELLECVNTNQEDLNTREQYYISLYNSTDLNIGYNLDNGGTGFGKHSEQTKQRISNGEKGKIVSQVTKIKQSTTLKNKLLNNPTLAIKLALNFKDGMLNKHHSDEAKKKISVKNTGKKLSDETKLKIKNNRQNAIIATRLKCCKKVVCVELDRTFNSITEANIYFGRKPNASNITNIIETTGTAYGYHWIYYAEETFNA